MKAVVFQGSERPLSVEERPADSLAENQIRVQVRACGICGSDIHYAERNDARAGIVFGHEFSGIVSEVGSAVTRWHVGDRVVPMALTSCGKCSMCAAGKNVFCKNVRIMGFSRSYTGAYSEYVVVGENDALHLPDNVDFYSAAAIEPLAVGYDSVARARLRMDDAALIIGAGPIGLVIATWLKHFGITHIGIAERNEARLDLAARMGANVCIDANDVKNPVAEFKHRTGRAPSVIFEAVGVPGMIQSCVEMAEADTRLVVVGVCQENDSFMPALCTHKRLEMIFPFGYSKGDYENILNLIAQGRIDPTPLISHVVGLDGVPEAFEALRNPNDQIKVLIDPTK